MNDPSEPAILTADHLELWYGKTSALADASVEVRAAEVVALVGPSGSGKTSLLHCLAGLLRPTRGEVTFRGAPLPSDEEDLASLRRCHFGFVFQFAELIPELTLAENIELPLQLVGEKRSRRQARVAELADRLGIADQAARRPGQVSGGQAQRAAVARALAHRPAVIFADEPTGSLDAASGEAVLAALLSPAAQDGSAVLLVTHEAAIAAAAGRTVHLRDGRVERVVADAGHAVFRR